MFSECRLDVSKKSVFRSQSKDLKIGTHTAAAQKMTTGFQTRRTGTTLMCVMSSRGKQTSSKRLQRGGKIKAGLAAVNCTATRVLGNADKALRKLMHSCHGNKGECGLEQARSYGSTQRERNTCENMKLGRRTQSDSLEGVGLHKNNLWAFSTDWSAHVSVLRRLSLFSEQ